MYGETSFELICQILDKLHPISEDNKFIDLGSGVGQVVLQVAALTHCQISLGIEKAKAPSKFARVRPLSDLLLHLCVILMLMEYLLRENEVVSDVNTPLDGCSC